MSDATSPSDGRHGDAIKIHNWRKWQSYRSDRGQPPWIKVHRSLARDDKWAQLTDVERGQLISLWLLAAEDDGCIPSDPKLLRKLCMLDSDPDLQKLAALGFIDSWRHVGVTSTPGGRLDGVPEAEEETEVEVEEKTPNTRARGLPKSWMPTSAHEQRAKEAHLDLGREVEKFRNHAAATNRKQACWNSAFTNWLMRAEEWAGGNGKRTPPGEPLGLDIPLRRL